MNNRANIASLVQNEIADLLNADLSAYQAAFIPENSLDIEFEVKSALAKQGCAGIVAIQSLEYQGHNQIGPSYDIQFQLQIAENPTIHRAALKKNNLSTGTGMDIALSADQIIADVAGSRFGQYCLQDTAQAVQGGLVVTTSTYKGFGCYLRDQPLKKWTCEFAPEELQDAVGDYNLAPGSTTKWNGPNGCVFTMVEEDGKFIFDLSAPEAESLHYEVTSDLRPNDVQFESYDSTPYYINFTAQLKTPHYKWAGDGLELNWAMDNIEDYLSEGSIKVERYLNFTDQIHQPSLFCYHLSNGELRYELTVWYQDEYGTWSSDGDVIDVVGDPDTLNFNNLTTPVTLAKVEPNN